MRRPNLLSILGFLLGFVAVSHFTLAQAQDVRDHRSKQVPAVRDHRDTRVLRIPQLQKVHPAVQTNIDQKYQALGGPKGFLGKPTKEEQTAPDRVGKFRHYEKGSIYWHPRTGAYEVHGLIREKWASLGWERSCLGYPISDELGVQGVSRFNKFQGGKISWTPQGGAVPSCSISTVGPARDHRAVVLSEVAKANIIGSWNVKLSSPTAVEEIKGKNAAVDDWVALDEPLSKIEIETPKDTTVVLADNLEFTASREYNFGVGTAPKNIILVADSVRLLQKVSFDLSAKRGRTATDRSGGSLIIIARRFSCETGGRLSFVSVGRQGDQTNRAGGNGGKLVLVTEEKDESTGNSCIEARTDGGAGFSPSDARGLKGEVQNVAWSQDLREIKIAGLQIDGTYICCLCGCKKC